MQTLGLIIVSTVIVQLALCVISSIQQVHVARKYQHLTTELLLQRIAAEQALRERREEEQLGWHGIRKFEVQRRVEEADQIASFYLVPRDGKPLPPFKPGQYLTFHLDIPGLDEPEIRCYSLSDCYTPKYYRVTIKRVPPARPDSVSHYFHDHVVEGDILDVEAPRGHFWLEPTLPKPVVLIGGGVGITPMISMISSMAQTESDREVWLFYGVRNGREHAMKDYLLDLAQRHENLRIYILYSRPDEGDVEGRDYHYPGHVSVDVLKKLLESSTKYDFYLCGPPPMMASMMDGLQTWGVPKNRIFSESFGPASVAPTGGAEVEETVAECMVNFSKSGQDVGWTKDDHNLLAFAKKHRVKIRSGCRTGQCGTCEVAVKSGNVKYLQEPGFDVPQGSCLTCIAVPDGNLVLDA